MSKGKVIQFPDSLTERGIDKLNIIQNRIDELETENEFLDGDIEYLQQQLISNHDEVAELFKEVAELQTQELEKKLVQFKSDFGVEINFDPDFDLTPEDK